MLIKLIITRIGPFLMLAFTKGKRKIAIILCFFCLAWLTALFLSVRGIYEIAGWRTVFLILLAMLPQYLFYGFAGGLLLKGLLKEWSVRVWKRIVRVAFFVVFLGVLTEKYINFKILRFFFENFK